MSKEALPNHCQMIMVAEREKVDRLVRRQHTEGVPLPSYRYGRRREAYTQNYSSEEITLMRSKSACAGWQCRPAGRIVLCPITVKHTK